MAVYLINGQHRRLCIVFISQQDLESNQAFRRNQIKRIHLPLPAFKCADLGMLPVLCVYTWVCVFFFFFLGGYSCGRRSYFSAESRRHLFEVVLLPFLKMFGN